MKDQQELIILHKFKNWGPKYNVTKTIYISYNVKRKYEKNNNESLFSFFDNLYSVNYNKTFKLNFYYIQTLFIIYNIKKLNIYTLFIKFNIFNYL
jgi:hypothetical protein